MSSTSDNEPDLIELTSNIGTWVAAGMAIVALVGVVGPLLAIQASMSDRNRAMNAVDQPQKYISRGFRLTKGLRVFRRIRVPDLAPGYITNEPDRSPLAATLHIAMGRWALRPAQYSPWGAGWAKLSELIDAYEIRDGTSNAPVELGVPKTGGALEIVNSRTALVVHKHWIMVLGLLGRYGHRVDKGVLQKIGIRRDIEGERASIRHFQFPRKELMIEEKRLAREEPEFEWVRKKSHRRRASYSSSTSASSSGYGSDSDSDSDAESTVFAVRRSEYGVITLGTSPQPTIYGVTGTMQALGRHKGSWSYLTSISFVPHTAREIFGSGVSERQEHCSMQSLFWMAHGFLPHGRTADGRQTVVSLESPGPLFDALDHLEYLSDDWPAYSLQESDEIPVAMGLAMQRLGIPEPKVLQFLPVDEATQEKRMTEAMVEKMKNGDTVLEAPARSMLKITASWVYYRPSQDHFCAFLKADMERVLTLILTLEWDDWGFLILKDKLWVSLLRKAIDILRMAELTKSVFAKTTELASHARVFRWRNQQAFNHQKLADHLALDKFLTTYCEKYNLLPLRRALGTLYILDRSLREMTEMACERLSQADGESRSEEIVNAKERIADLERMLTAIQCEHRDAKELLYKGDRLHELPTVADNKETAQPRQRFTTRLPTRDVDLETLNRLEIYYEYDMSQPPQNRTYVVIGRLVPEWELEIFWQHTKTLRQLQEAREAYVKLSTGVLEYQYEAKRLRWYRDKTSMMDSISWRLRLRDVVIRDGKESMWIEERDMVMVGLWAANRAAMWIGAQDSRPLLKFVGDLDTYLYVL